jgi:hypothetical protein
MAISTILTVDYDGERNSRIVKEQRIDHDALPELDDRYEPFSFRERVIDGKRVRLGLKEAFVLGQDAANMFRNDFRYIAFSTYAGAPTVWEQIARVETSNKKEESWLLDSTMGRLPKVVSGDEAPNLLSSFAGSVNIVNNRYAGKVEITGDMLRFDQINKIRQIAAELGRAARNTEEAAVMELITTTGTFDGNSTTGNNDIGANQAATTFTPANFETILSTIATAKDPTSGMYKGYNADTIIAGPRSQWFLRMFFSNAPLARDGTAATAEAWGLPTQNPFAGLISKIIISPWFGASYQFAVFDSRALSVVFQRVEPFNVYEEAQNSTSEAWLTRDVTRYLAQGYFGVGMVDDDAWYYSSSSTAPAAA